ncbi:CDP-diacylglycerol-inositol 3-phosphatidyltransferase [Aspergillus nanangensis]|uniref:CDP-diacylglycerol-inositol 3-phosphatidyltransferase n=1 Tax=Aspergillus nanangensis TaxID=2582783 RepID=A0AAD4CGN5_ASPNN|nr:CDP-diacylglycerol-inositol 3-phosphatidyltransferase [Aspergillus nanangensis]
MPPRTRKQKAALAAQSDGDESTSSNGAAQKLSPRKTKLAPEKEEEKENVYWFIPNLIGYARIILAFTSLYYMPLHPRTCSLLYSVSCLLDALDGYAARHYNQSTTFGGVLDMVTDRCTTACLLVYLSSAWPRWAIVFQGLICLDLASHWIHMYTTLTVGGAGQSHKNVEASRSRILYWYYNSKTVLFICCALNELFFIGLYLLSFSSPTLSPSLLQPTQCPCAQTGTEALAPVPTSIFASPWSAGAMEMARANKLDSFFPWVITLTSFPVWLTKQIINVVQLKNACNQLVELDLANRRAMRNGKKN